MRLLVFRHSAILGGVRNIGGWRLVAGLLIVLLVCPVSFAARAEDFAVGDYLEDRFLATLRATRSPWVSERRGLELGYPQGILVQRHDDGVRFDGNFNWHEGCWLFSVTAAGAIRPGENGYCGFDPGLMLKADRPGHFLIAYRKERLGYTRVGAIGSMDRFVSVVAVGGRYRDARGGRVVFDAQGLMTGLAPEGPFSVSLDHIMEPFDTVVLGNNAAHYGYRWQGRALVLYPLRHGPGPEEEPWGRPDYAHPFRVLNEIVRIMPQSSFKP